MKIFKIIIWISTIIVSFLVWDYVLDNSEKSIVFRLGYGLLYLGIFLGMFFLLTIPLVWTTDYMKSEQENKKHIDFYKFVIRCFLFVSILIIVGCLCVIADSVVESSSVLFREGNYIDYLYKN